MEEARFCTQCGTPLKGLSGRIKGFTKRIAHKTNKTVEDYRLKVETKINELLTRLDDENARIGSYTIPDHRKPAVRRALERFQNTIGFDSPQAEMSYEEWIDNLPSMLEAEKCIVCFGTFNKGDDLLVCPHCETGGHREHIIEWINRSGSCPFCRESLRISDLIQLG